MPGPPPRYGSDSVDEQTCLRALARNPARPLSSREQRIARGRFAWGRVAAMWSRPAARVSAVD